MSEVPTEAVEYPHNQHIELPSLRCFQHLIERRSSLPTGAYTERSTPRVCSKDVPCRTFG